jgi:hypothetical protein
VPQVFPDNGSSSQAISVITLELKSSAPIRFLMLAFGFILFLSFTVCFALVFRVAPTKAKDMRAKGEIPI